MPLRHLISSTATAGAAYAVIRTAQAWLQARGTPHQHDAERDLVAAVERLNEQSLKLKKRLASKGAPEELDPIAFLSKLLGG